MDGPSCLVLPLLPSVSVAAALGPLAELETAKSKVGRISDEHWQKRDQSSSCVRLRVRKYFDLFISLSEVCKVNAPHDLLVLAKTKIPS